jgi:hypothetical protein
MDAFRVKLDKKRAKVSNFKQSQAQLLQEKEALTLSKKAEIEQLTAGFKQ